VCVGVQEMAAHQQSELFWRFHLQNVPRRWREAVCSSETLPPAYPSTHPPTNYLPSTYPLTYLPDYRVAEHRRPWYSTTEHWQNLECKEDFILVSSFLFNDVYQLWKWLHTANFLTSQQISPPVTLPDFSLSCLQDPNYRPYPEPDESC
jgi:hypothetical protein